MQGGFLGESQGTRCHDGVTDNSHGTGCHDTPGCQICRIWHSDIPEVKTLMKFEKLLYGLSANWAFRGGQDGLEYTKNIYDFPDRRSLIVLGHTFLAVFAKNY